MKIQKALKTLFIFTFLFTAVNLFSQSKHKFIIILDAGHGGKDPGNSYHGYVEKEIALATTIKVENFLKNEKDIEVIYTRKNDVFVELVDRPKIANKKDADLFVSIHCNSVKNEAPFGTETFVMGLSRSNISLEIAKQENSVIFLEKNYQETYKGFDPHNPETVIGINILQEEYLNRSINLASKIENNFINKVNRKSRGIKQAPLWVLDAAYMPSVLIELGFLSNKEEGRFLNSDNGQDKMAEAIANAIISYKKEYFDGVSDIDKVVVQQVAKPTILPTETTTSKEIVIDTKGILFKVQIAVLSKNIETNAKNFKGLNSVSLNEASGKLYKYTYGNTTDFNEAIKNLEEAKAQGFKTAFLIAYKDGVKITIEEALK